MWVDPRLPGTGLDDNFRRRRVEVLHGEAAGITCTAPAGGAGGGPPRDTAGAPRRSEWRSPALELETPPEASGLPAAVATERVMTTAESASRRTTIGTSVVRCDTAWGVGRVQP